MSDMRTTYMGLPLKNPVIAASSGLTGSIEDIRELVGSGAAAIITVVTGTRNDISA